MSKKVIGSVKLTVHVTCPECGNYFDLMESDHEDDYVLSDAIHENTTESCTDMELDYQCPECECEFILDSVEY